MVNLEACPVCDSSKLSLIGHVVMRPNDPPDNIQEAGTNILLAHVLHLTEVAIDTLRCACGHIFLSPTFDDDELDRLYSKECDRAIKQQYRLSETTSGLSWADQNRLKVRDQEKALDATAYYRPKHLKELVLSVISNGSPKSILDFGARTGDLTKDFVHAIRYVYDKDPHSVTDDDVFILGEIEEVIAKGPYDLIVLSHVLEHIPQPTKLLAFLREQLILGGLLYIEVPIEYCGALIKRKGIPLGAHINYFNKSSLLACLDYAGFDRAPMFRREISPYGECQMAVFKVLVANKPVTGTSSNLYFPYIDLFLDAFYILVSRKVKVKFQ